jgi:hypothetical protein
MTGEPYPSASSAGTALSGFARRVWLQARRGDWRAGFVGEAPHPAFGHPLPADAGRGVLWGGAFREGCRGNPAARTAQMIAACAPKRYHGSCRSFIAVASACSSSATAFRLDTTEAL